MDPDSESESTKSLNLNPIRIHNPDFITLFSAIRYILKLENSRRMGMFKSPAIWPNKNSSQNESNRPFPSSQKAGAQLLQSTGITGTN
jgi:hypothetical protein